MSQAPVSLDSADSTAQAIQVPCPRCKQPLIDPKGLGWCRACGYCQSLADSEKKVVMPAKPTQPNQLTATGAAVGSIPIWFWVMSLGIALIAGAIYYAGRHLVLQPLDRAVLTLVLIGTGLIVLFVGQFIGLMRIAPEDATLTFKDAVVPMRLYGLVFKRLPSCQMTMYGGAWGITLIAASLFFVGGLTHLFKYLPKSSDKKVVVPAHKKRA